MQFIDFIFLIICNNQQVVKPKDCLLRRVHGIPVFDLNIYFGGWFCLPFTGSFRASKQNWSCNSLLSWLPADQVLVFFSDILASALSFFLWVLLLYLRFKRCYFSELVLSSSYLEPSPYLTSSTLHCLLISKYSQIPNFHLWPISISNQSFTLTYPRPAWSLIDLLWFNKYSFLKLCIMYSSWPWEYSKIRFKVTCLFTTYQNEPWFFIYKTHSTVCPHFENAPPNHPIVLVKHLEVVMIHFSHFSNPVHQRAIPQILSISSASLHICLNHNWSRKITISSWGWPD